MVLPLLLLLYTLLSLSQSTSNYWKLNHKNTWPSVTPKDVDGMDIVMYGAIWDVRKRWRSPAHLYARIYLAGPVDEFNRRRTEQKKKYALKDAVCVFHLNNNVSLPSSIVKPEIYFPDEQLYWYLQYERFYFDCPYNHTDPSIIPSGLSLHLPHVKYNQTVVMKIEGNISLTPLNVYDSAPKNLAICVRPLTFGYNEYDLMKDFLVYYSALGVEHFELYVFEEGINKRLMQIFDLARSFGVSIATPVWGFGKLGSHEFLQTMNAEVQIMSAIYIEYTYAHMYVRTYLRILIPIILLYRYAFIG